MIGNQSLQLALVAVRNNFPFSSRCMLQHPKVPRDITQGNQTTDRNHTAIQC